MLVSSYRTPIKIIGAVCYFTSLFFNFNDIYDIK